MVFLIIKKSSSSAHFVAGCFSSASACFVCLSSFLFLEELALKLLKWKKVFVFRSLDITTENNNTHSTHTHTHTNTRIQTSWHILCKFRLRGMRNEAEATGYCGGIGGTGPGLSAGFLHGGILGSLCVISVVFSFCFSAFFLFFGVFFLLLSIPLLPAPQFCRCFVFPIQLKADSRKNFFMKLNRCQFIRLKTRQYL